MTDQGGIIERIAASSFEIPREVQYRLIEAAQLATATGIGFDRALGTEPQLPDGARARRDYFLRRAFAHFRALGNPPVRQFRERLARAARRDLPACQRRGALPDAPLAACLCLALLEDPRAGRLSVRSLERIVLSDT